MKYNSSLSTDDFFNNEENIIAYPNPTSKEFVIDLKKEYQEISLEIYDVFGKLISRENYFNSREIASNIQGTPGIYFLKLSHENKVKWLKLIKE